MNAECSTQNYFHGPNKKTKGGPKVAFRVISLVLSAFDNFFDLLLEAVDTCNGEDVGQTEEDNGDADED